MQSKLSFSNQTSPLSARMRPKKLNEILGQDTIVKMLSTLIENHAFCSLLLYGPPGCGKTSLAEVLASELNTRLVRINAVVSNVQELRLALQRIQETPEEGKLLFIDELHRFNRAQQDLLLPFLESGEIHLIGATTLNPRFSIIPPLLSRCRLLRLKALEITDTVQVLQQALDDANRGLAHRQCTLSAQSLELIAQAAKGDARQALNLLESLVLCQPPSGRIEKKEVQQFLIEQELRYDGNGDDAYAALSAYIKSIRGCDPDAAIYWMTHLLEAGEDPRLLARRLVIAASEDIGLADSRALGLAIATFDACERIGLPECAINLAHATVFLATAPKSNTTYLAWNKAKAFIGEKGLQKVPIHLKNPTARVGESSLEDYQYSHDYEDNISGQSYLECSETFYEPKAVGSERHIIERLETWKALKNKRSTKSLF